jgi:hypothetical protein
MTITGPVGHWYIHRLYEVPSPCPLTCPGRYVTLDPRYHVALNPYTLWVRIRRLGITKVIILKPMRHVVVINNENDVQRSMTTISSSDYDYGQVTMMTKGLLVLSILLVCEVD